ncbi:hypothetical protein PENTCL1PPCAC_29770 [Pristionchus entomophagus]|uniref:Uncharacterized protein n=1 Tax=Pristionchus entomophagus TaxID=358040 RepID=A0AAV5UMF9_9BILA|nr:hypothetical protein PENTCL1PPCAC_29770 [Pristionchus entomophagus]
MLECAIVCLLANSVSLHTDRNDTACSFCVDARSTHENCFENVIDCAYRDPHGIIFCTNFFETLPGEEFISRQTRCISYYDLLISDESIRAIVSNGNCQYRDRQYCDCPKVCPDRNLTNGGWPHDQPTTTKRPPQFPKVEENGISIADLKKTPSQLIDDKQPRIGVSFIERAELYLKDIWGSIVSSSEVNSQSSVQFSFSLFALFLILLSG